MMDGYDFWSPDETTSRRRPIRRWIALAILGVAIWAHFS